LKTFKKSFCMCVAVCLDVGMGILIFHLLSRAFGYLMPWYWYGFGIFFSLFVDCDILVNRLTKGRIAEDHHKFLTHYPLPMFLLVVVSVILVAKGFGAENRFAWFLATTAFACLFSHYLHDSLGDDTKIGIRWLWPFKGDLYIFFGSNGNGGVRKPLRVIPGDQEHQPKVDSINEWLETYLKPTKRTIGGIVLLIFAIALAFLWR